MLSIEPEKRPQILEVYEQLNKIIGEREIR
jgi:hypothetical protein